MSDEKKLQVQSDEQGNYWFTAGSSTELLVEHMLRLFNFVPGSREMPEYACELSDMLCEIQAYTRDVLRSRGVHVFTWRDHPSKPLSQLETPDRGG